jgi:asparagine synthase (glutamine-hydrolysing)
MDAICGILGKCDAAAVRLMAAALKHRGRARSVIDEGENYCVASSAPAEDRPCLLDGSPRNASGAPLTPSDLQHLCAAASSPDQLRLRGAFAAAVRVGKGWWLLRDRLGAKPLYYAQGDGWLVFASELKGVLASGYVRKRLNLCSVDRYLTLRCVPGPESIIQGVNRVRPGHVLEYAQGTSREMLYAGFDLTLREMKREEAAERLLELLRDAVHRSPTDMVLWSAGIDCAAVGALRAGAKPVFVTLKSAWQAESWRARESARLLGLAFKPLKARGLTENVFSQVAHCLDEPLADASVLPLWLVAEASAGAGPALLSGHGADELLGGYPRYHFLQKAHGARRLVPVSFVDEIIPSLPPNAFVRRGGRYLASIRDNLDAYLSLLSVFDAGERDELYTEAMSAAIAEKGGSVSVMRPHFSDRDLTRNLLALSLNVALPDLLLAKCDRLWAAHGASLEFPYLDDALIDFAVSLPPRVKFGVRSKPLLRQAMKGVLPGRVRLRARRDFKVPQSGPTLRVIESAAREIVNQDRVEAAGVFRWPYVDQVLRSSTHNVYRRRQFWALLMFFAWYRAFME